MRWDIFCTVIDNFGDIGITWRLARQLTREHGVSVRLWVDDLVSFQRICPGIDPKLNIQCHEGVEVRYWEDSLATVEPGDVVIEALACCLPDRFELAMAKRVPVPLWINLEYLSAEDWVKGCHVLPSPHPRLPLTKYFFMPGYVVGTGGLLKEKGLSRERNVFQADVRVRDDFWQQLDIPTEQPDELRISLFSYESGAIESLFRSWARGSSPLRCLVPEGKALANVARFFHRSSLVRGDVLSDSALTVHILPMLSQDSYDHLLWACDCNFVRGEDSFVRAMWAGKPLVWQAYRQEEGAHWPKIEAFLDLYCADMEAETAQALRQLWRGWNEDGDVGAAWGGFWARRDQWVEQSTVWQAGLAEVGDLVTNLVKFHGEKTAEKS